MLDFMCFDCGAGFDECDLIEHKCPECNSSRYDYYEDVVCWDEEE